MLGCSVHTALMAHLEFSLYSMLSHFSLPPKYVTINETNRHLGNSNSTKTKTGHRVCVMCHDAISPASLSFEQRLVNDKDFCRKCWDEIITNTVYPGDERDDKPDDDNGVSSLVMAAMTTATKAG
ncbi:hypothetical protein NTE_02080 [Candidatus Nitrososphaera evergladensis SR1]|uniref:Uncharacterized protein n=1 Tax=Candidatus Nitrososphaera evergladensis SR1 TaxID=1459636 RepID=A0A075MRG0_9ARCH|nr:hypothetical protein NTE_02080 [Candidatus Nitrososphaera evergladensis SR1]